MKKVLSLSLVMVLLLTGCAETLPAPETSETATASAEAVTEAAEKPALLKEIFSGIDFSVSPFKHITNGGITEDDTLPYNIDAISGATMTVEGPAVVTSIPLSVRELENRNDGLVRGVYEDVKGTFVYEGLDLYYLLNEMKEGDNGILLTDSAYKVVLKNSNRAEIASLSLTDITKAHEDGRPVILAYGMGDGGDVTAPFVFDAKSEGEHSLGYVEALDNEDGCIKLVYDADTYGDSDYKEFSNVAYVYVCEETEPGFKHTEDTTGAFSTSRYEDYIVTFRGDALGREYDLTVKDLESLVTYAADGSVTPGGIGYSDWYSLANNAYWYVNEYEGLDLYKLLLWLGMESYEEMGAKAARTTLVSFIASDGAASNETFSVDTLSYPDAFGFYNKNAADLNDGSYVSTNADLVKTGFPVLMSYGVNNYPYTIQKTDDAYVSGLANSGGPFRVVFGKTQYNHPNGSNQVQYLSEVIAGKDVLYNTHQYTDDPSLSSYAENTVKITVNGTDGTALIEREMTVGEIEDIIFGEEVAPADKKAARRKDHYEGGDSSAIYEGVDIEYFLMNVLGLPGTNGTATFTGADGSAETLPLERVFAKGYNTELGREGLSSILSFAKNGSPLVPEPLSDGYQTEIILNPFLATDPDGYLVENDGGPLCVLIPASAQDTKDAVKVANVTEITVDLVPDSYAHIEAPYSALSENTVRFYGEGLDEERTFTVSELESRQTQTKTLDYSFLNQKGTAFEGRYRGLPVYDLFSEIGIKSNAGDVTVYASDGTTAVYSLSQLKKASPNFLSPDKAETPAILAYGTGSVEGELMEGFPLVSAKEDKGYSEEAGNDGGPLKLIVPQREETEANASLCMKDVVAIEVSANDVDTWSHSMSDVYEEFLDDTFTFTVKNDENEWTHDFTVKELESLKEMIVRAKYTVLDIGECEGLDMWKFIQKFAGDVPGIDDPVAITVYANDGYKNDILSVVYKEGFEKGVATEKGDRLPVMLCYAINGYPNVDDENHAGYTGLAGNTAGPLRAVVEGTQGASVKYCVKLVVTVAGSDPIDIDIDPAIFGE